MDYIMHAKNRWRPSHSISHPCGCEFTQLNLCLLGFLTCLYCTNEMLNRLKHPEKETKSSHQPNLLINLSNPASWAPALPVSMTVSLTVSLTVSSHCQWIRSPNPPSPRRLWLLSICHYIPISQNYRRQRGSHSVSQSARYFFNRRSTVSWKRACAPKYRALRHD